MAAGNWRDNHSVVESAPAFGRRAEEPQGERPGRAGGFAAPAGNWRDTAKPVAVDAQPARFGDRPAASGLPPKRPELNLLPRTAPVESDDKKLATEQYQKSSKPNPFGSAKPREVILAEKEPGQNA